MGSKRKKARNKTDGSSPKVGQPPVVKAAAVKTANSSYGFYAVVFAVAILGGYGLTKLIQPGSKPIPKPGVFNSTIAKEADEEVFAKYAGSRSCRDCHEEQFKLWESSHHALAERPVDPAIDKDAFDPPRSIKHATQTSTATTAGQDLVLQTLGLSGKVDPYKMTRVIGVSPLLQFMTENDNGRVQAAEMAWDPHKKEWFNVYGDEDRRPGEWGHWTGRGMNWNAMCASCHNTRLRKNYDSKTDSYHTRMAEMGVGCESCHGPMKDHADWQNKYVNALSKPVVDPTAKYFDRDQYRDNCGPCHARRTELTGDFIPGQSFYDHHSLVFPDETDIFYADGQIRDEDYEFTSFLSSRMHSAGVRCFDCHEPHSTKLRLPGNQMCMYCHNGKVEGIPGIDPLAHSHHKSIDQPGGRCVDCHMPLTTYMQRHPRRDHGFTIPDPLLTKQFGIPNACGRCHAEKGNDWMLATVNEWYGDKMNTPYRQRAQMVAMAKTNAPGSHINLIKMAQTETNFLWRAASAGLMRRWLNEPTVQEELLKRLTDKHPLVRGTAALSLEPLAQRPNTRENAAMHNLLTDPVRKVRIDAAWILRATIETNHPAGKELLNYFAQTADQPAGLMQQGVFHFDRNNPQRAAEYFRKASTWDTNSAPPHHELAVALSVMNQPVEAIEQLRAAIRLAPTQAEYRYKLALGLNEINDLEGAKRELEATVKLEPQHANAWYNLGLAHSSLNQPGEAIVALQKAEKIDHQSARIPYARATILMKLNRRQEAMEATRLALTLDPDYGPARSLWQQLSGGN